MTETIKELEKQLLRFVAIAKFKGHQDGEHLFKYLTEIEMHKYDIIVWKITILKATEQARKEIIELINIIEKSNWDCSNKECGVVNSDRDICKKCGAKKETSWDNNKLEELKQQISGEGE